MVEQVGLFDELEPPQLVACQWPDHRPSSAYQMGCRCRRCVDGRRAYNRALRIGGPRPCVYPGCDKPRRRVQAAKYCEEHATSVRLKLTGKQYAHKKRIVCECCGAESLVWKAKRYPICATCTTPVVSLIKNAGKHGAPWVMVQRWMQTKACDLCSRPLHLGKTSTGRTWPAVVDHDHACCDGAYGCEKCVRGLLCNSCNMGLGVLERMREAASMDAVMAYLRRTIL